MSTCYADERFTGNIQLILGPMFAGKSSELIRRVSRYQIAKKNCLLIKYIRDTRYDEHCIATHDRVVKNDVKTVATDELNKIKHLLPEIDILGIDEGQFFPDLLPFAEFAANEGKVVIVSALDGDFLRKPFGSVCDLIPLCEHVVKLKAVCMVCQRDAAYSRRITNEEQTEVIGGSDKYIAVCRRCYNTENVELTPQKKRRTNATTPGGSVISGHVPQASPKAIRFLDSI